MVQDILPHIYHNEMSWQAAKPADLVIEKNAGGIVCRLKDGHIQLPTAAEAEGALQYLFSIDERAYFWLKDGKLLDYVNYSAHSSAELRACEPDETMFACAVAESLIRWYVHTRFCGACGAEMENSRIERAMVCPKCGNTVYPKICPAVIAAVYDGDRLVLTRYKNRPFKKYALVAGFNEIGESIEDTVRREVLEETGLRVGNLRFYKSQPWVYTDCLLMGFFAELDGSDEIHVQEDELAEAGWFTRDEIPEDHSNISLTGEMIECFRTGNFLP